MLQTISTKARALLAALQMRALITLMAIPIASRVVIAEPRLMNPVSALLAVEAGWQPRR